MRELSSRVLAIVVSVVPMGAILWLLVASPSTATSPPSPATSIARGDIGKPVGKPVGTSDNVRETSAAVARPANALVGDPWMNVGSLRFEIHDAADGAMIPGKVTVVGCRGTENPQWTRSDVAREESGLMMAYNRVFSLTGVGTLPLLPGTYDVYVSRGLEWDLFVARNVRIAKGRTTSLNAKIRHVVDTPGWLSGDFHVHAAMSPDSRVPMIARIYEFVAEGIDMIVSTDHNVVADYGPYIEQLGVGNLLVSARGDEITTSTWGHFGAFPLSQELAEAGHGAIPTGGTPDEILGRVRNRAPGAVVDVHHPRLNDMIGYFTLGGFDARTDRAERPGFSFDFDAVEVLNGYQDPDRRSVDKTIEDWFGLLDHGHIVTATGNSDTHHLTYNLAGYPRNYVRIADDHPARVAPGDVALALKRHQAFFTTGPFVRVTVGTAEMGDIARAPGGRARVDVEVRAAPWVSVSRVILYVGGREVARRTVPVTEQAARFHDGFDVTIGADSYVVVRVDGDKPLTPVIGDGSRFVVYPLALTNPVFLDGDGDGRFDPPLPHGTHGSRP